MWIYDTTPDKKEPVSAEPERQVTCEVHVSVISPFTRYNNVHVQGKTETPVREGRALFECVYEPAVLHSLLFSGIAPDTYIKEQRQTQGESSTRPESLPSPDEANPCQTESGHVESTSSRSRGTRTGMTKVSKRVHETGTNWNRSM